MIRLMTLIITLMAMLAGPAWAQSDEVATEKAILAGGCFWCVESDFDKVEGVISTISGYIGGTNENPTYRDHAAYGHREAVEITYDPAVVDYAKLLDIFFRSVDPTDAGGQFCDRGFNYTTAIYTLDAAQQQAGEQARRVAANELDQPVVTEVIGGQTFWPAEEYHQDYYLKNPVRYKYYRSACRRDARVKAVWGDSAMKGIGS